MNYLSSGYIKDLAIINLSYALLEYEENKEFLDKEYTKKILEIKQKLYNFLAKHYKIRKKILAKTKRYLQEIFNSKLDYTLPLTIFALKLLSLSFPRNQRQGKALSKDIETLWLGIKEVVNDCENRFFDTVDEDLVVDCEDFYYKVIRLV